MRAAAEAKAHAKLLAVTVLTSMNDEDALEVYGGDGVGFPDTFASDRAHKFALMAAKAGCDGVVCSAREVANLRLHALGNDFIFVTPGIRPKWSAKNDQERVTTPTEAVQNGSRRLVIGRPILQAKAYGRTPVGACQEIAEEIRQALR
jgi:orotidine-5'-phosphate decarboxylase